MKYEYNIILNYFNFKRKVKKICNRIHKDKKLRDSVFWYKNNNNNKNNDFKYHVLQLKDTSNNIIQCEVEIQHHGYVFIIGIEKKINDNFYRVIW